MNNSWEVKIISFADRLGRGLYIIRKNDREGRNEVLQSDGRIMVADEGVHVEPSLFLSEEIFRELVNAIHKDYKPSEGKFTEGKLEATEKHLEDLRALLSLKKVETVLEVQKPRSN